MVDELIDLVPDFPGKANQTRCFAHVLNLIAKTIIKQFDAPKKNRDGLSDDEKMLAALAEGIEWEEAGMRSKVGDCEPDDDDDGWVDEFEVLSEGEWERLDEDLLPIRLVIAKVRFSEPKSNINQISFIAAKNGLQNREFIHKIVACMEETRAGTEDGWETDAEGREDQMELDLRNAWFCNLLLKAAGLVEWGKREWAEGAGAEGRWLEDCHAVARRPQGLASPRHPSVMIKRVTFLQIFRDATAFFSRGTPNLATIIPAMDHIDSILASQSVSRTYDAPIRVALAMGKKTLNHYYTLTDASEVYRIAMGKPLLIWLTFIFMLTLLIVLHPHHKLSYFATASWEPGWITTAREIVHAEFNCSYAAKSNKVDGGETEKANTVEVLTC
jgi:hypothetical protein